ncbi:hypothetical protein PTTG_25981 [Puccinia triticina 1-1 BBBD Race 1]|uniref:Uncharacterized protein n=1 Tax=Puccinia triticina (isolate 1-1 / race 1 (BBBD)) TaxID=630390 RepID=A0A180GXK1_PUCT1|nr:hypothetical protein PTTG_25981 [Puccinia triticina 1-1 BBBD Race 1]
MALQPSHNSYKRTTSCRDHFWVLIWLACVFLENVQCTFDRDSAHTWPTWARTMQEADPLHNNADSGYLHDVVKFADATSESQPILRGIDTYPPPVQQERQNSLYNLKTPVRKRKSSGDDTELPFAFVNYERPAQIETEVIFEAIRSLEQPNGDRFINISNEREDKYRVLKIEEGQIYNFLDRAERASDTIKLRSLYSDLVIPDFANSMEQVRARIRRSYCQSRAEYLLEDLERILKVLPLYLFYVDLINTVIPVRGVRTKGVTTLKLQRQEAGQHFFQHASELLEQYDAAKNGFLANSGFAEVALGGLNPQELH